MKKFSPKIISAWVISVLLGASFLFAGFPKISPNESMISRFEAWGYSGDFAIFIGIVELTVGLTVLWPRTVFYGALLLAVEMIGAAWTHIHTGIGSPLFAFIYLAMAMILLVLRRKDAYWLPEALRAR